MELNSRTKEVFVFGAGASHASARTPLGKDLLWNYYRDCHGLFRRGDDGEVANGFLEEENPKYSNYEKFLALADTVYPELNEVNNWRECRKSATTYIPPTNEMYNLVYKKNASKQVVSYDRKYYVDEMLNRLMKSNNIAGVELVRQLILEHLGETGHDGDGYNKLYKDFVKKLYGQSDVSIISINFDCLFHFHENYDGNERNVYFDYGIPFDSIDSENMFYKKENPLLLLKLNGSLDWAICPKCKKTTLLFPYIRKSKYTNLLCNINNCHGTLRPYIYLPHETTDRIHKIVLDMTGVELKKARRLTIIGYSFPSYDTEIINLFSNCVRSDTELVIVDYANNEEKRRIVEENYETQIKTKVFPGVDNIKLNMEGFEGYLQQTKIAGISAK